MAVETVPRSKSFLPVLLPLVLVPALAALCIFLFYYVFLISLDGRGPFHNTTAVADLDGDGDLDVALTNLRREAETIHWHVITLWFNEGGGRFSARQLEHGPYLFLSTAAGDLDGDGDADLAGLRSDGLQFFLNQGGVQGGEAGTFRPGTMVRPAGDPGTPGSVVLGDLDNDGALDGFVAGCCGFHEDPQPDEPWFDYPSVSWSWLGDRTEPGRPFPRSTALYPELEFVRVRAAALADLDGDGNLDAYLAVLGPPPRHPDRSGDRVLLNDGTGALVDSGRRLGDGAGTAVALGDLDADGDPDALVGAPDGAQVWLNQGGAQGGEPGDFTAVEAALDRTGTEAVFLADFDGDGDLDALIAATKEAAVWWNDGQGGFEHSGQRLRFSERHGLEVGDFDGDGSPDVFAAAYTEDARVWFNRGDGVLRGR